MNESHQEPYARPTVRLLLFSRVRLFVHEVKRKIRIFAVSCRSAMNFVRESLFAGAMRNSGSVWRSAFATTNSEGGIPGRMVRSQEPRLYGLRFKIECSFKQAVRQIDSFAYHFWMKDMIPLRSRNGNQYLHRKSDDYRNRVRRKMRAYHTFIQAGVVAQGLLQYLAVAAPKLVWDTFGSWLRTIRPGIPPSEFVVANALRQTLPEFLMARAKSDSLTKFITERQDTENMRTFRLAS